MVPSASPVVIQLPNHYYDDFTFDNSWTVTGNAVKGMWQRGEPVGTVFSGNSFNPDFDVTDDCSIECYVTGNAGGTFNDDDVDDGFTQLASPVFDLTSYTDPYLNYERWFYGMGSVTSGDTLFVTLTNGTFSATVEMATMSSPSAGTWVSKSFRILDYIPPSATMQLTVYIQDKTGTPSPLECGFDKFQISEGPLTVNDVINDKNDLFAFPNPFVDELKINSSQKGIKNVAVYDITGRKVYEVEKNKLQNETLTLNLSSLQQGTYILKVVAETNIVSGKIFKM